MGLTAGVAGVNLYEVVGCGGVKEMILLNQFLLYPTGLGWEPVNLGIYMDATTAHMVFIVFVISFLVHLYSTVYMGGDPRLYTFLAYLTLFTFFMVVLLVSPNYVQLFMGWEGVGLTSYLLVNFWYTRAAANKSALKALLVNRVGDFFLLYFLFLVIHHGGGIYFPNEEALRHPAVGIFLVVAAAAKSAQLGLHTWLPDAMEGPTPVSALIHAATMVTAGVFLLLRSEAYLGEVRGVLLFLGSTTAVFAGSVALFQYDLKRVIAYSTCAQLGYMVTAVAVGHPELGLYHLVNHAYFKALLFLLAGLVIHALADEQDTRRMGGLINVLPVTYTLFGVGSLALGGFPFLSGYYSKENILEVLYAQEQWYGYAACVAAAYFTVYYSVRLVILVFLGYPRGSKPVYLSAKEADPLSLGVVTTLGVAAVLHGWIMRDVFVGWGTTRGWSTPGVEAEFMVPLSVKLLPLGVAVFATVTVSLMERYLTFPRVVKVHYFFAKRWWWDFLDGSATRRILTKGYYLYVDLERGLLEWVGPTGIRWGVGRVYEVTRNRGWFPLFFVLLPLGMVVLGGVTDLRVGFVVLLVSWYLWSRSR
jgi:proton-translocating NADH-quinone oxidoreductase chain L